MELLLAHAIGANITIPEKRLKVLVETKRAARAGSIPADMEVAFWAEFLALGKQLHPISMDSLKATSEEHGTPTIWRHFSSNSRRRSRAGVAVRNYQLVSILALVALLIVQIYTIFGSSTVHEIETLSDRIEVERLKIEDLNRQVAFGQDVDKAELFELISVSDLKINQMSDGLFARRELLVIWFPVRLHPPGQRRSDIAFHSNLQMAKITLESISKYILPLLYGLLGACVYVVRSLSHEIKNLTYTPEANIRYRLRIYLGALAGLAIGWFVTQGTAPTVLQSITPVALAFLAGYGVEILFSAMDAVINAFTRKEEPAAT